jgi:dihydrolipoamide dehydrogenase
METSARDIYAAGDLVGGVGTTPVARMEGVVAARNACGIITEADYRFIPNSMSLYYDITFFNQNSTVVDTNIIEGSIPGFAGPGAFWRVLDRNTGFTKVKVNQESGEIRDVTSISPSARTSMAYISKMMRDDYKTYDFDDFMETHPSTDPLYKLMRFFARYG